MNNLAWADEFVAGLAAAGLKRAVLAPGARSSPLALAFLRRREIACEVVTDERVAGYFALGLARGAGEPAAVVVTSGTAAANLMPAVMEANLAGVPLLLLTADRPPEAHGWGANQTADQARLYGNHVRACHAVAVPDPAVPVAYLHALAARLLEECGGPLPGPVHANLPFREPLLPPTVAAVPPLPSFAVATPIPAMPATAEVEALAALVSGRPGVILCGEATYPAAFGPAVCCLAAHLGAPVLAEPLANLRFTGLPVCAHQSAFLRQVAPDRNARPRAGAGGWAGIVAQAGGLRPDWIMRFGAFPVSRTLESWLAACAGAEQILVAPPGRWPDPLWRGGRLLRAEPLALVEALLGGAGLVPAPRQWLEAFEAAEVHAEAAAAVAKAAEPLFEGAVAGALLDSLPRGGRCFVGNSLAIRAVDSFGGVGSRGLVLHGNRGASGIDGNVATAAGIAAATGAPTGLLIGDQAALHDCGGFAALRGRDVVAVVMDNGGGGIFDHLPLAATVDGALFERAWVAPAGLDLAGLAAAHGLGHRRAATLAALRAVLAEAFRAGGPWLVEVPIDRRQSLEAFHRYFTAAAI